MSIYICIFTYEAIPSYVLSTLNSSNFLHKIYVLPTFFSNAKCAQNATKYLRP